MPKSFFHTALICLSLLAAEVQPYFVQAGGSGPEQAQPDPGVITQSEPMLDLHERQARATAAALARSRAEQDLAVLAALPAAPSERMRPTVLWNQSLVIAGNRRLGLPAAGDVHRGYDRRTRHYGIDIVLERNAPIFASADGVVVRAGWDNTGYGRMVWLDHGDGLRTLYGHLNSVLVAPGQTVQRGQLIGLAGSSGHSTGPHLHFEVKQDNVKLDPLAFFPDGRAPLDGEFVVASTPGKQGD